MGLDELARSRKHRKAAVRAHGLPGRSYPQNNFKEKKKRSYPQRNTPCIISLLAKNALPLHRIKQLV
jgi:hypothetical protein